MRTTNVCRRRIAHTLAATVSAIAMALAVVATPSVAATAAEPGVGDPVYVAGEIPGPAGTGIHGIFTQTPADPNNPGTPDYWAYCIENKVPVNDHVDGTVRDPSSYLGGNYYTSSAIQGKVLWVLAHSYPYVSLSDFGNAAGVPGIAAEDAIEATQYAIWRYTDLNFDANWNWHNDDSKMAYWYLVNGANASNGMTPADLPNATASVTGPTGAQTAGTLVGPFTVSTNQPTASISVSPAYALTDASGARVDATSVTNGEQFYLDLRGSTAAGSATVTISAKTSGLTGKIISVATQPGGTPTALDHAQTLILVAPAAATATDAVKVAWVAGTPSAAQHHPAITTRTSASRVVVGHRLRDKVRISGFKPGGSATGTARLYGPFTSRSAATCTRATLARTASFTPRNGRVRTTAVKVRKPGYYTWVASISADAHNTAATHRCGLARETTLVHKRGYGTPVVRTGFSGVEPRADRGARVKAGTRTTLHYPGIGVSARAGRVGISRGAVRVPGNVARLGYITQSAGLADAVGTTVLVGHVSDDHDSPGAFYRLSRAKKGQIIKVRQHGHTYRFRVARIRTYSRARGGHPPASAFSTTRRHALVLISCAAKVVYPNGHFHYTRNIVVTATPVR